MKNIFVSRTAILLAFHLDLFLSAYVAKKVMIKSLYFLDIIFFYDKLLSSQPAMKMFLKIRLMFPLSNQKQKPRAIFKALIVLET